MGRQLQNKVKRGPGRPKIIKELSKRIERLSATAKAMKLRKIAEMNAKKLIGSSVLLNKTKVKSIKDFPASNQNKILANSVFASHVVIQGKKADYYSGKKNDCFRVIVLDGIENNTSNTLMSMGIKKENIRIIEHNEDVSASHIKNNFKTFCGSLEKYGQLNIAIKPCLGAYFDTCVTINTETNGILSVLKNQCFIEGTVLMFTFTRQRNTKEEYSKDKDTFIKKLNILIARKGFGFNEKIIDNDYSGELVFNRTQWESAMNTFGYTLKKIC
jgi:hypothetical protein